MALVLESTHSAQSSGAASTSFTMGAIGITDADRLIVVGLGIDSSVNITPTCHWDSSGANSSFSQIGEGRTAVSRGTYLFYLWNPSTGSHAVEIHHSSGVGAPKIAGALVYAGADSTTPVITADVSTGSGTSSAVTSTAIPSATGDLVVSAFSVDNVTASTLVTATNSGTIRVLRAVVPGITFAMSDTPGDTTVTSGFNVSTVANIYGFVAANVKAAGSAGTVSYLPPRRGLMGIGR